MVSEDTGRRPLAKFFWAVAVASAASAALAACGGHGTHQFPSGVPPVSTTAAPPATGERGTQPPRTVVGTTTTTAPKPPGTTHPTRPASTTTTTNSVTMQLQPPAPPGSPAWVAAKFVQAYYGSSYAWPDLGYWVTLAKPYMTPALYARFHYLATHADNPGDKAYFDQLRKQDTTYLVDVTETAVEHDAPNTADRRYVLVSYQLEVLGLNEPQGGAPYGTAQELQCVVVRARPGAPWRVSSYNTPDAN